MKDETSTIWTAPDGSNWLVEIEWADVGGRVEPKGLGLRSVDRPKRHMDSTLWRSLPVGTVIQQGRITRSLGWGSWEFDDPPTRQRSALPAGSG